MREMSSKIVVKYLWNGTCLENKNWSIGRFLWCWYHSLILFCSGAWNSLTVLSSARMGRCNNQRTQAAAAALKNTPSRARFSKGPPNRTTRSKRSSAGKDALASTGSTSSTSSNPLRKPSTSTAARVINQIQTRQQQLQHPPATTEEALAYLDKTKLDHLKLDEDVLKNISSLLERLGVKETSSGNNPGEASSFQSVEFGGRQAVLDAWEIDDARLIRPSGNRLSACAKPFVLGCSFGEYTEYDEDFQDHCETEDFGGRTEEPNGPAIGKDYDGEGEGSNHSSDTEASSEATEDDFQEDAAFVHLTQQLSFSESDARRACRAIQDWDAVMDEADGKGTTTLDPFQKETVTLAMDWLCLHLTESQLLQGFRPNKNPTQSKKKQILFKSGIAPVGAIKAIPHPSISLATDTISDKAWARSIRLQERILKFVRLGFSHAEATQACNETSFGDDAADTSWAKQPPLLDPALPVLLSLLRSNLMTDNHYDKPHPDPLNDTDLQYAAEERQNEREALEAIYDDQFQVTADANTGMERYILRISPSEALLEPARSEDCQLHVFLRPGYPVIETPLLWFSNPNMAPSLLRQINEFMTKQALKSVGSAAIFEIVNGLADALPELQLKFIRLQRRRQFEAEQAQLGKQRAGHLDLLKDGDAEHGGGKIGRRQKAKLRAADKSYDRDDQQQEQERRKRQEERVERAKQENSLVRKVYAEQTLLKREQEKVRDEAEKAARMAMNTAFNRGESAQQARRAANLARKLCLEEHGVAGLTKEKERTEDIEDDDATSYDGYVLNNIIGNPMDKTDSFTDRLRKNVNEAAETKGVYKEKGTSEKANNTTTPQTVAFMERLRQMYDVAAKTKPVLHLCEPTQEIECEPQSSSLPGHTPRPVAIATGELGDVMQDILKQQEEQPWLISPEARVLGLDESIDDESLSRERQKKQRQISRQLKQDLELKLKSDVVCGEKYDETNNALGPRKPSSGFEYCAMLSVRKRLPAFKMGEGIVETIAANQITVIAGDTGCGKTTQVPQLVLDDRILKGQGAATNIIVTQPRRISAIGVSERISKERTERVGETCGYSIKLEKKMSSKTRLLLCTTGVLLRRLQCDPDLASVSHVFVDEVHERDLNTDFLIIILKDLLVRRKNLKLVLMSATLNSEAFSAYFCSCPIVSIPGRTHPVEEHRLEDILELTGYKVQEDSEYSTKTDGSKPPKISKSALRKLYFPTYSKDTIHSLSIVDETVINYELIVVLLEHVVLNQDEGAVLVFMPGMMEITKTIEEMHKKEIFQSDKIRIYPLHSSLSTAEQTAIFEIPPKGVRKIVVSTNIAETSITIEDVVYVVDAGRVKENRRDEINETPTLVECWVSRASAKQRRGRAGRVRPGISYHLYSTHTHDNDFTDYQLPEMLRVGIEDLVLQVLVLDLGEPSTFLGKALNPPSDLAMRNSLKLLETLGAVECQWAPTSRGEKQSSSYELNVDQPCSELKVSSELTALGFHLATLPVDPRVGKLMIYGSLLGCVDPALTIAANMSSRSPFISPFDQRDAADEARKNFAVEGSDHLTILNAFEQWKALKKGKKGNRAVSAFLKENFLGRLSLHQMEDLRNQFARLLKDIGFLPSSFQLKNASQANANANSHNTGLIKAVLCAGLYPNILVAPRFLVPPAVDARRKEDKKAGECAFQSHRKGEVYLHPSTIAFNQSVLDSRYYCYSEIQKTSKVYVRGATSVNPFALLLFGGTLKVFQTHAVCSVDDWLKFRLDAKPATLIKYLRAQMERILLQKIVNPQDDVVESAEGRALIESISVLFASKDTVPLPQPDRSGGEIVRPWTASDDPDLRYSDSQANDSGIQRGDGRGKGGTRRERASGRGGR